LEKSSRLRIARFSFGMFTPETHRSGTLKVPARRPNLVDAGSLSVRKSKTGLVEFADLPAQSSSSGVRARK